MQKYEVGLQTQFDDIELSLENNDHESNMGTNNLKYLH